MNNAIAYGQDSVVMIKSIPQLQTLAEHFEKIHNENLKQTDVAP